MAEQSTKMEIELEARVYLMIRRARNTFFVETTNTSPISKVKAVLHKITRVDPERQRLFLKNQMMEDDKTVKDYIDVLKQEELPMAHNPITVGLAVRSEDGVWEDLEIVPVSDPLPLPEAMRAVCEEKILAELENIPVSDMTQDKIPLVESLPEKIPAADKVAEISTIEMLEKMSRADNPVDKISIAESSSKISMVDHPLEKIPIVGSQLDEKAAIVGKVVSVAGGVDQEHLMSSATTAV